MKHLLLAIFTTILLVPQSGKAQLNQDEVGAWYMYFFNANFGDSRFGMQGDIQHRNWNVGGDLEQLMLRGGLTYTPNNTKVKFTLGYGNITTGTYGDDNSTTSESRIYQEALIPQRIGNRFYLTHRFRYEQRFVDDQDFRTRFRYNLFVNVALNKPEMTKGTVYLALYNELFMNAQRNIGDGRSVEYFDRNRTYGALGYVISPKLKVQAGYMRQSTNSWQKDQIQLSLHHKIR